MSIREKLKGKKIIEQVAKVYNVPVSEVRQEIQSIIDDVWGKGTAKNIAYQNKIFPDGKPSAEEFIVRTGTLAKREMDKKAESRFDSEKNKPL